MSYLTKIIFKVDPVMGMCVIYEDPAYKRTIVVRGLDVRTHEVHVFAEKPVFVPGHSIKEKDPEEIKKMFEIFKR